MKKIICFILVLFLVSGFSLTTASANNVVTLDGGKIVDNRTLVPLRSIFEELGAIVQWDQKTKTVTATKEKTQVWLKIGSKNTKVNGKTVTIDVPAQVDNGVTLVPLRFISESMGANVEWNSNDQSATINLSDKTIIVNVGIYDKAYAAQDLVVKSSPGTSYKTLGEIKAGTDVKVYGGVPIGQDQGDWYSYEQYGWSKIKYEGQTAWVATHELSFADPFNWAPGIKSATINEIIKDYVSENDKIKLEKSSVTANVGFYTMYIQYNGEGEWHQLVVINCKTGWYHG